jgi:hypothetical protein
MDKVAFGLDISESFGFPGQLPFRQKARFSRLSFKALLLYSRERGWTTEGSEFESRQGQDFYLLNVVQTGSGAHPASYPMGTGSSFPGGKAAGA